MDLQQPYILHNKVSLFTTREKLLLYLMANKFVQKFKDLVL